MKARVQVRVHFTACIGGSEKQIFLDAIEAVGIVPAADEPSPASVPLLVVFRSSLEDAMEAVRAEAAHGYQRSLALSLDSNRLDRAAAFRLIKAGASDVFGWASSGSTAERVAARLSRWLAVDAVVESASVKERLVGASRVWRGILRQAVELALFSDAPVLVTGETGTGKEIVARLIHDLWSGETKREFVVLDCTTVVPELSGSEFFGHEKGAFTGAFAARDGAFAMADGGTLFLDELGELPVALQAELLRVVQEQTYKRVGGSAWHKTRFRLVCATHRDLLAEQRAGRFRSDLFYRISGWTLRLPPLRDRREDVLGLVRHFLAEHLTTVPELEEPVRQYFLTREFPGNVRELRQLVALVAHRHVGPAPITPGDLGLDAANEFEFEAEDWCDSSFHRSIGRAVEMGVGLKEIGRIAEDSAVKWAVHKEQGSLQSAARKLGVTDRALQLRRASQRTSGTGAKMA